MIEEAHGNIPQSVVHEMSAGLPPDLGPTPRVRRGTDVERVPPPGAARSRRLRARRDERSELSGWRHSCEPTQ